MTQIWHKYDTNMIQIWYKYVNITSNTRLLFPVRIKGSFVGCGCRALLACWPPDAFRGNLLTLTNMHINPQTLLIPTSNTPLVEASTNIMLPTCTYLNPSLKYPSTFPSHLSAPHIEPVKRHLSLHKRSVTKGKSWSALLQGFLSFNP